MEHRLFSHITMNWRGRPLTSHEVIVNTIAATTTTTGLTVRAELDTGACDTGIKISDRQRRDAALQVKVTDETSYATALKGMRAGGYPDPRLPRGQRGQGGAVRGL